MRKALFLLPAMLIGLVGCGDSLRPTTIQFDYIFTAQPVVSSTGSTIFKNVQEDFKSKSNSQRIIQASVFVNKNTNSDKAQKFLDSLRSDIEEGITSPALIKSNIESVGSAEAQKGKFGVPGAMAMKVTKGEDGKTPANGFSLGYEAASSIKDEINNFVHIINSKVGQLTDDHIFSHTIEDDSVSTSDLKILSPTGAPAVAFYKHALNNNYETTGNPATVLIPEFKKNNFDIIVAPTHGGLMQVINNSANFQIAATITFGNMYIVSTGKDNDGILNNGDKVLYFQEKDIPGIVFNYVYGDLGLDTYAVADATTTSVVIQNGGILKL